MELSVTDAETIALDFLVSDLEIPEDERDWLAPLSCRFVGESWYVVEVGVEGLPDKWVLQVYDTGECDPSYTFVSPIKATEADTGLEEMPDWIAEILKTERNNQP